MEHVVAVRTDRTQMLEGIHASTTTTFSQRVKVVNDDEPGAEPSIGRPKVKAARTAG